MLLVKMVRLRRLHLGRSSVPGNKCIAGDRQIHLPKVANQSSVLNKVFYTFSGLVRSRMKRGWQTPEIRDEGVYRFLRSN